MEDIEDAMFRGTSMPVPYTEWLKEVSGKPYADKIREATQFTDDGISQKEAGELAEKANPKIAAAVQEEGAVNPATGQPWEPGVPVAERVASVVKDTAVSQGDTSAQKPASRPFKIGDLEPYVLDHRTVSGSATV